MKTQSWRLISLGSPCSTNLGPHFGSLAASEGTGSAAGSSAGELADEGVVSPLFPGSRRLVLGSPAGARSNSRSSFPGVSSPSKEEAEVEAVACY